MSCQHSYKHTIRKGCAKYICPKCKADITMELLLLMSAKLKLGFKR